MTTSGKPKKVLIQFAVALVVAIILGIGAVFIGFTLITSVSKRAEHSTKEAEQKAAQLQVELERIKSGQSEQTKVAEEHFKVVQAQIDIHAGQPITADMLVLNEVSDRPPIGTLDKISQALGKVARSPMLQGETLTTSQLVDGSVMQSIPAGHRAITIRLDSNSGVSGALLPGAKVDVLTTVIRQDKAFTRTLLQNIPVLAVGASDSSASVSNGSGGGATSSGSAVPVTLLVTPREAEAVTLASQVGTFHLTLRNFHDSSPARSGGANIGSIVSELGPPPSSVLPAGMAARAPHYPPNAMLPMPSAAKSSFTMKIYRGSGSETMEFQR
jgi:pilus assembly protein CpaB